MLINSSVQALIFIHASFMQAYTILFQAMLLIYAFIATQVLIFRLTYVMHFVKCSFYRIRWCLHLNLNQVNKQNTKIVKLITIKWNLTDCHITDCYFMIHAMYNVLFLFFCD